MRLLLLTLLLASTARADSAARTLESWFKSGTVVWSGACERWRVKPGKRGWKKGQLLSAPAETPRCKTVVDYEVSGDEVLLTDAATVCGGGAVTLGGFASHRLVVEGDALVLQNGQRWFKTPAACHADAQRRAVAAKPAPPPAQWQPSADCGAICAHVLTCASARFTAEDACRQSCADTELDEAAAALFACLAESGDCPAAKRCLDAN